MRFIDEARIRVAGGHGGPGCVSFRREKFIPRGGPDGGDGGQGGSVSFIASVQLSTLQDFRFKRSYIAPAGNHGSGSNKAGRDGLDIVVRIPVGTLIKDAETGEILKDFTVDGDTWVACKGGRGGKGNAHFVSATFQAPKFAQPGEDGEQKELLLELKLLADVGIIGYPNAGKSTLISRISAARPKVADYAFTTLTPNLGVVSLPDFDSFVVADIPGLIEGAHKGMGLGHRFLKHIERTRMFIHLLDGTKLLEAATRPEWDENGNPVDEAQGKALMQKTIHKITDELIHCYKIIRTELGLFNEALLHQPELVVINKADLFESDLPILEEARKTLRAKLQALRGVAPAPDEPLMISCSSGYGIGELLAALQAGLLEIPKKYGPVREPEDGIPLPEKQS